MINSRVEAHINLSNIKSNYHYIKSIVGEECKVMAVVKAEAYGHGANEVSRILEKEGCGFFAVACIEEAIKLRKAGINSEILILGITDTKHAETLEKYNLIQTVGSLEYAKELSDNGGARIHLKVDTGMSRLGLYCHYEKDIEKTQKDISDISFLKNLSIEGIFTHFADSDNSESDFTAKQFSVFTKLISSCENKGIKLGLKHCCNSGAILNYPHMKLDMVRAGIILYGLSPSETTTDSNLKTAMTLKSRIAAVSHLNKGDYISYGCTYKAESDLKTAVISIGYADGFSRALSGRITVKIKGRPVKILGKICMDLCVADVTGIDCSVGDDVVIFENEDDINNIANLLGTINYEVVCLLKSRVKLIYNNK